MAQKKTDLKKTKSKKTTSKTINSEIYVAALGASAGGLDALERFFKNVKKNKSLAYIVVPHLDPKHTSLMPELIQKHTNLKVQTIEDGMGVEPNHIYIVPPNNDLALFNSKFQLMEPTLTSGVRMPIDYFLRTLADDKKEKAICTILSGMGTDGTQGLKYVKAELGLAVVQKSESAAYKSMPQSAISTGLADFVLNPEDMPDQLIKYVKYAGKKNASKLIPEQDKLSDYLEKIYIMLRSVTGHDFSAYKKNTIIRRIERRMTIHQIEKMSSYVRYLQENSEEVKNLFSELLIGVTSFFRDPEAFELLKTEAFPKILEGKPKDYVVRIWVPGCSSGEEAYTIAIILRECIEQLHQHFNVQIFATDIDANAIETARAGIYPTSISQDIGTERLKRFFTSEDNLFKIKKDIREMLVFAPQDIIKDPPFTKLDLICCRNLLIYLDSPLQKKLMPLFHYSLKSEGILMLGTSETIGSFSDLFAVTSKKWKIFSKKETTADYSSIQFPVIQPIDSETRQEEKSKQFESIAHKAESALLKEFAPPSVIIDEVGNVLYFHGRTGKFLEPAQGEAKFNIYEMAREGIKMELPAAVRKAKNQVKPVFLQGLRVKTNGGYQEIDVTIKRTSDSTDSNEPFMVVFTETSDEVESGEQQNKRKKTGRSAGSIESLEKELQYTKESLQTTIEELETSNEELKSTNEELQSTNEELQSTNEELETSKEEQQSLNEELTTVNSELQGKIDELSIANNDMKNLLDSINIPTIFLDNDLCIKRYTSFATKVISVIASDVGRPVSDIATKIKDVSISEIAKNVLKDLKYREQEVLSEEGDWYLMRVLPYRTIDNIIDGVVIRFQDITEQKKLSEKLAKQQNKLEWLVEGTEDVVTLIDPNGIYLYYNGPDKFGLSNETVVGKSVFDILDRKTAKEAMRQITEVCNTGEKLNSEAVFTLGGNEMKFFDHRFPVKNAEGVIIAVGTVGRNVTDMF